MKSPIKTFSLLASATLLTISSLSAVSTDPVGYTTINVNSGADTKVGISLFQAPKFAGSPSGVTSGVVSFSEVVPDLTTLPHFLLVTSDNGLLGQWYEIVSNSGSSVTVSEDLEAAGLTVFDTIKIIPFWTLDTLFPDGGNIPASSDVTNPVAQVLFSNVAGVGINLSPAASYIYHSGEQGPAGWYDLNNIGGGLVGDAVISPESFITIRNESGSAAKVVVAGNVPVDSLSNNVISYSSSSQDNLITNPYPAGIQLQNSGLFSDGVLAASPDVTNPVDQLLIYEDTPSAKNPSPVKSVIYHSGEQGPAGWYDLNDIGGGLINSYKIPASAALVIRKSASSDAKVVWSPATPY
ncbi:TIGR02597 family protein [Coraliomargarita sp. SDUM461003]|uniref:TIGR02597 family protein n=1 Tax=Thalassobacterium maritimum TaxID=3041265 RepID=A0ABU1AZT1_9BACT|nr:TIGR02597 family protein [Coraliomargarita sp. SDUM461003]MDQ8208640.1 TIGR02597 family protein [Coraliomargarita sp. SDUM461003]